MENGLFVCPKCKKELFPNEGKTSFVCESGHTYDVARQGYVNLYLGHTGSGGDDREMCLARHRFHGGDYYRSLADALSALCRAFGLHTLLDAGCGEGYYLRRLREDIPGMRLAGLDLAKEAVLLAAREEKTVEPERRIAYAVAGIFAMPVADGAFDGVLSVFAPVPDAEARRVLKDGGMLIVVSPDKEHLEGLKRLLYDEYRENAAEKREFEGFRLEREVSCRDRITVRGDDVRSLFHMTPYYWKTSPEDAKKLANVGALETDIAFWIRAYRKIGG